MDLFMLISGYFLCKTQKRSLGKVIALPLQLILFKEAHFLATVLFSDTPFSFRSLLSNLLPNHYFVILYCACYLISPYVNPVFEKLSPRSWRYFLLTILLVFSVWNTLIDLAGEILETAFLGLSTVARSGSDKGYTLVNFLLMYCVGAYLRFNPVPQKAKSKTLLLALAGTTAAIFLWSILNDFMTLDGLRSAWVYHNPLVILMAVLLFLLFSRLHFQNKIINSLAAAAFTCFLFHPYLVGHIGIQSVVTGPSYIMLLHILAWLVGAYLVSWVVYEIYHNTIGRLIRPLDKISIPNLEEEA